MSRTALNGIVDAVAYACFVVLATTGLMLQYQMPPGSGGLYGMGSGTGVGDRTVTVVWGLSRHEWGTLHYWIALVLMGVLVVHLLLHWKWIVCVLRGKPHTDVSGGRFALGIAGLLLVALLAAAPLLTPAQTAPRSQLHGESNPQTQGVTPNENNSPSNLEAIQGFMTLEEVARMTGVPVSEILQRLHLPADTPSSERVGRLVRANGMEMSDLRTAVGRDDTE